MNKDILNSKHIFLDVELKSQKEAFEFLAQKAADLGIVTSKDALVTGFENREKESSTGFEDGFAIPHARIKETTKAACLVVKLKEAIDWNSMDGKPTQYLFALIVPDGKGEEHMSILSDIATKLMNDDFKSAVISAKTEDQVLKAFDIKAKAVETTAPSAGGLKIVAISACVVGIAHTYMAEDKLIKEGAKMGHQVRVETHGSKGIGTPLTAKEIEEADVVLFAVDVNVDSSRFVGKKFYKVKVAKAIHETKLTIESAIKNGTTLAGTAGGDFKTSGKATGEKQGVLSHILAGISYMIPVIVLGGICLAFSIGIAKAIWGPEAGTGGPMIGTGVIGNDGKEIMAAQFPWNPLAIMDKIGGTAFALMIPILAGFIGNSIAGRAAIAPAMVGAFIGNDPKLLMPIGDMTVETPMGFIGAIIAGLAVGYFVKWINSWNVPRSLQAAMPIFFIPLVAGILISVIFIYVIGGPIGWVMGEFSGAIKSAYGTDGVGIGVGLALGILLGAMAGFDMGGPINKIAFVTSAALVTEGVNQPMGAMAAAIPVAPIAMGLTTIIFARFFDKETRGMGIAAIIMGTIGISEGAIPFAIRDPKRAIVSNVIGSAVAGGIAGAFLVTNMAAHGGPIVAILGAVPYGIMTLYFFIAVGAGVATTTLIYGFWLMADAGEVASVKEAHVEYLTGLGNAKREAISEIKSEIKTLKANKDTSKIEAKKSEIKTIIEDHKAAVAKAKVAYSEIKVEEKALMKVNSGEVKAFNASAKSDYTTSKTTIKAKELKGDAKADAIEELKKAKADKYREFQNGIRGSLVAKYQSATA
ncbi:fructose-specific PTS transporter subunit EIIC [Spiroplasma endosymbiont of Othius punctulatus]|uniref:PTS fructose transporter subunit IIABC n=1 Tax=Spiroplasma endosymbiont of Othius punctulatus TaxID=3066289 RepID=UPI0030D55C3B